MHFSTLNSSKKVLFVTNNLELQGAPWSLFYTAKGYAEKLLEKISTPLPQAGAPLKRGIVIAVEKDRELFQFLKIKFEKELSDFPIYVVPIEHQFMFNEAAQFNAAVITFIKNFNK